MKPSPAWLGPLLVAVGVAVLVYQGFAHWRMEAATGSPTAQLQPAGSEEFVPVVSILGVLCLGGGIFLLALGGPR